MGSAQKENIQYMYNRCVNRNFAASIRKKNKDKKKKRILKGQIECNYV